MRKGFNLRLSDPEMGLEVKAFSISRRKQMLERQELHCHNCNNYVQFSLDMELSGQHILTCPKCGHKHYRIVENGKVTEARWGQDPSQQNTFFVTTGITFSSTSTFTTYQSITTTTSASASFFHDAWSDFAIG